MISKFVIGNRKPSEYSTEVTKSKFGEVLIASLILQKGCYIDFDMKNNMQITNLNDVSAKMNNVELEINSLIEKIENNKESYIGELLLNIKKQLTIITESLNISTNSLTLESTDNINLKSKQLLLGDLSETVENDIQKEYGSVMIQDRFNKWWDEKMKPFIELINTFIDKYNTHTHSGNVPPPGSVLPFNETIQKGSEIDDAEDTTTMLSSSTTKTI